MKLQILKGNFAVCKLENAKGVDFENELTFFSKTDKEISLVCSENAVPDSAISADKGWSGFRLAGSQELSQVGIISKIAEALATCKIAVFIVSTFETDYVFVKTERFSRAIELMMEIGYSLVID